MPANATSGLIFGFNQIDFLVPGTTCFLLTDVFVVLPFMTNAQGNATHVLPVPSESQFQLNLQQFFLEDLGGGVIEVSSTNGLRVSCS